MNHPHLFVDILQYSKGPSSHLLVDACCKCGKKEEDKITHYFPMKNHDEIQIDKKEKGGKG